MYKKILIATDGSELAGKALRHGLQLAGAVGASVVVVNVTEMWSAIEMSRAAGSHGGDVVSAYESAAASHAQTVLSAAESAAKAAGVSVETVHIPDMHPSEGVLAAAKARGCDLIVMATHGRRGLNRVLLGSQTTEVVTHSEIPVLVLR